jgi:hypothetical protein
LKVTIYAYGIILWEMATRLSPYDGADPNVIVVLVQQGTREDIPSPDTGCPEPFAELIRQCWHQDPSQRPDVEQVIKFIKNMVPENNVCITLAEDFFPSFLFSFFFLYIFFLLPVLTLFL